MTNKELIERLKEIGKLPTAEIADATDFPLDEFEELLDEFTLPLDLEIAVDLVNLSPPVDEGCHGLEWSLIHLLDNVEADELQKVLNLSQEGEVKRLLQIRLDNFNEKNI